MTSLNGLSAAIDHHQTTAVLRELQSITFLAATTSHDSLVQTCTFMNAKFLKTQLRDALLEDYARLVELSTMALNYSQRLKKRNSASQDLKLAKGFRFESDLQNVFYCMTEGQTIQDRKLQLVETGFCMQNSHTEKTPAGGSEFKANKKLPKRRMDFWQQEFDDSQGSEDSNSENSHG